MKTVLLSSLLCVSMFGLTINFTKTFENQIKPDTLQAQVNITVKAQSEKDVAGKLGFFSSFIDDIKDVEKKGGNYNVYPEYQYENNKRYLNGYAGNMNYQIRSKYSDKLNSFLSSLYNQKSDNSVNISTSSVSWIMSDIQKTGKVDALRLDAIIWSDSYAKSLSKSLSKECTVNKIVFDQVNHYYPTPRMMRDKAMTVAETTITASPVPTQDLQKISVNPAIELICK